MKTVYKILLGLVIVLVLIVAGGIAYFQFFFPKVDPPKDMRVDNSPEMIERGRYLANHVAVCLDCHSTRNWGYFAGPVVPGTEGGGGELFDEKVGFPGSFVAKNITPHGLASWTDGEVYRAITVGVRKNGEPLFPVMPYPDYGKVDPDDIKAIIAYIRTLKPIKNNLPESHANFPLNLIMRTIPKDQEPGKRPAQSDSSAYGEYLVQLAGCAFCHTPAEKGQLNTDLLFSGGHEFPLPDGSRVRSANITMDKETGIGSWSREQFIQRFKAYGEPDVMRTKVAPGEFNTIMPWTLFAGMKEEDLAAIYHYLKTVPAQKNLVTRFVPKMKDGSSE